ncbi:MAG: hypothetical protein LH481_05600, partial [Burkholderiales bacterium]|nr:hypothetical protein [Burkholderiales bacterium]
MNFIKSTQMLSAALFAATLLASPADAAVTLSWSTGATCGNAPVASFSPGGAPIQVSLCVSTTLATERGCGFSAVLLAATAGESGAFRVTNRTLAANYPDATAFSNPFSPANSPFPITNPPAANPNDFGGTIASGGTSFPPALNQLLATFTFQPQSTATNSTYVIGLAPASEFSIDVRVPPDPTCGEAGNSGAALPTLTLNLVNTPLITSAATTTFTVAAASTFNVTATGTPPLAFAATGTLPAGVSLSAAGILAGTPQSGTAGAY